MIKMTQNLHTHCIYCDGKNTPREMAERAIALGFDTLGFSSHANTIFNDTCELRGNVAEYRREIQRLKGEYDGRLRILLGIELDTYSEGLVPDEYDYKIASVHYGIKGGEKVCYDFSAKHSEELIERLFDGSGMDYAKLYFETMAEMPRHIDGDFVGHFDLLTKYEQQAPHLFDTGAPEYRRMALDALSAVREKFEFFEVNTGTIGRGYKMTPYPAPFILDGMRDMKCKLIITSDCHNAEHLDCGFDIALDLIRAHGFNEIYNLTPQGFRGVKI